METATITENVEHEEHNREVMLWGYLTATLCATLAFLGTVVLIKMAGLPCWW